VGLLGGRAAEIICFDEITTGAASDIKQATHIARMMVTEWGMSDKLGMVEYGEGDSPVFLARDMTKSRNYSEETARVIDAEIKRFIDDAYQTAERILNEGRDKVELIAKALLEFETLDASHLKDLIEFGEMKDPPSAPKPPPVPEAAWNGRFASCVQILSRAYGMTHSGCRGYSPCGACAL
jgi:cell division protease FtsH